MTTMDNISVECCVCGTKSIHLSVGSTNAFGYPELDTRPPEMERSTIYHMIQRCLSCGYCSSDLSTCLGDTEAFVKSKNYQDILSTPSIPEEAASYLASSYIISLDGYPRILDM
jgi:ribosomal protein L37E